MNKGCRPYELNNRLNMSITNKIDHHPDLMSNHMKIAADARGWPNSYENFPITRHRPPYETWLSFKAGQKSYYYTYGVLLEAGADPWGWIGRNINHKATLLSADKYRTKCFLKNLGFNVPEGRLFRRRHLDEAIQSFDSLSKPICVKPNCGRLGQNIFPAIDRRQWYEHALRRVAEENPKIIVEESVTGDHFRFLYVYPRVVAIRQGIPIHVVGNGVAAIKELLEAKNTERRQRALPTHPPFDVDRITVDFLAMQNLNLEDIPPIGQTVYLRGASNGSAGADTILLDKKEVHPSYCTIVEQACQRAPGLYYSGVDLIVENVRQPATTGNYWILELNANPAISAYYYPWKGKTVDVAGSILDFLAEKPDFS